MFESETGILPRVDWDRRFLELADFVSKWSKDPSTKVGAVITNGRQVVSLGFNGFPAGVEDHRHRYDNKDIKYEMIVHAEANAIVFARDSLSGCTIYVTFPPCARCAGKIIQAGIKRVVCMPPPAHRYEDWKESLEFASTMFHEAGVTLIQHEMG
jgi:dCMP deaminase